MMKFYSARYLKRSDLIFQLCRRNTTSQRDLDYAMYAFGCHIDSFFGDDSRIRLTDETLYRISEQIVLNNDAFECEWLKGVENDEEHRDVNILYIMGVIVDYCCDTVFVKSFDEEGE